MFLCDYVVKKSETETLPTIQRFLFKKIFFVIEKNQ